MAATSLEGSIPALLNPHAGSAERARDALAESGGFEIRELEPGELTAEVERLVRAGARRLVVAGGDGSIAAAATALAGSETELAIIPAGTLNHFARDLGISVEPEKAAALARAGGTRAVDLGRVNDRVFLNTSSVGAYVVFVRARERLERKLGYRLASLAAAIGTLFRLRTFCVELEVEGAVRTYRTALVFVGVHERELRIPMLGGRLEDGRRGLHVLIPRARTPLAVLKVALSALVRGVKPLRSAMLLDSFIVDACCITMCRPHGNVATDGEIGMMRSPLAYRLARDALRVVVPPPGEADAE